MFSQAARSDEILKLRKSDTFAVAVANGCLVLYERMISFLKDTMGFFIKSVGCEIDDHHFVSIDLGV